MAVSVPGAGYAAKLRLAYVGAVGLLWHGLDGAERSWLIDEPNILSLVSAQRYVTIGFGVDDGIGDCEGQCHRGASVCRDGDGS